MDFDFCNGLPVLRVAEGEASPPWRYRLTPEERRAVVRENMRRGTFHLLTERSREKGPGGQR